MTGSPDRLSETEILKAYGHENIVELGHQRAMGYQALLRDFLPIVDSDEMEDLIAQATRELDSLSGHYNVPVVVTGKVKVRSVDPRGINLIEQSLDPEAIAEDEQEVDGATLQSMGYIIERHFDSVDISHLAGTGQSQVLSSIAHGDLFQTNRVYIPINGSAYVELANKPAAEPLTILENFAEDLLQEVDEALLNTDNPTNAFQRLAEIDLTDYQRLIEDTDITSALDRYIRQLLDIRGNCYYTICGVEEVTVILEDGGHAYGRVEIDTPMTGTISTIAVDDRSKRFALIVGLPFTDNTTKQVVINLTPITTVDEQFTFTVS